MAFPAGLTLVTVAGQFDEFPLGGGAGWIRFWADTQLTSSADNSVVPTINVKATIAAGGFEVDLPATNDPGWSPAGFTYNVLAMVGAVQRRGTIQLDYQTTDVRFEDLVQWDTAAIEAGTSYATVSLLNTGLSGKSDTGHTHNDLIDSGELADLLEFYVPVSLAPSLVDRGNSAAAIGGAETMSRAGLNEFPGVSGRLWVNYFTPVAAATISELTVTSGGTAAVDCTLARICIFTVAPDGSVTLVARTASHVDIGEFTFSAFSRPLSTVGGFPASYDLVPGTRYAYGWLQVAGTAMASTGLYIADFTAEPVMCRTIEGQADIATSYAVGGLTAQFTQCYVAGRP